MTRSLPSFFFDPGMCSTRDDDDDRVYLTPNGENEKKALEAKFQRVSHGLVREGVQDTASREIGKSHVFFWPMAILGNFLNCIHLVWAQNIRENQRIPEVLVGLLSSLWTVFAELFPSWLQLTAVGKVMHALCDWKKNRFSKHTNLCEVESQGRRIVVPRCAKYRTQKWVCLKAGYAGISPKLYLNRENTDKPLDFGVPYLQVDTRGLQSSSGYCCQHIHCHLWFR